MKIQCSEYCLHTQNNLKIDGQFTLSTNAISVTEQEWRNNVSRLANVCIC